MNRNQEQSAPRTVFAALLGLILLGAILRFSGISIREFWYDEIFSLFIIQHSWADIWAPIAGDIHPPLYYLLLKVHATVFGASDFALRSFSAITGTLAIPLSYAYSRLLFTKKTHAWKALIPTLFVAVNPLHIAYSQETRSYTFLALLMLMMLFFLHRALTQSPFRYSKDWLFFSLSATAAFFTHYVATFAIAVCIGITIFYWIKHRPAQMTFRAILRAQLFPFAIPLILFILWWPTFVQQYGHRFMVNWIPPFEWARVPSMLHAFFFGIQSAGYSVQDPNILFSSFFTSLSTFALCLFIAVIIVGVYKKHAYQFSPLWMSVTVVLVSLLSIFIVGWLGLKIYFIRYLIGYGLLVVIAVSSWLASRQRAWIPLSLSCLYLLFLLVGISTRTHETHLQGIAQTVLNSPSQPTLITVSPYAYVVLRHYASDEAKQRVLLRDDNHAQRYDTWVVVDPRTVIATPDEWPQQHTFIITDQP